MLALFQQFDGEIQSGEISWHMIVIAERVPTLQNAREHSVCGAAQNCYGLQSVCGTAQNSYGVERRSARNT
jgi:hypothetical protein